MNLQRITLFLLSVLLLSSCFEDYLEEDSFNNFTEQNFYLSEEDHVAVVDGIYAELDDYLFSLTYLNAIPTNVATTQEDIDLDVYNNAGFVSNGRVAGMWNNSYQGVSRANSALDRIDQFEGFTTEGLEERLIAEARFLRAYYYFHLVRLFGDVPLITQPTTNFSSYDDIVALFVPRDAASSVYDLIKEDLEYGLENDRLPILTDLRGTADEGRATTEAAAAVLGLVHLTLGEFAEAESRLLPLHNSSGLALTEDYSAVNGSNTSESIFEIQYAGTDPSSRNGLNNQVPPKNSGRDNIAFEEPSGELFAELEFFDSFSEEDARKEAFFITQYNDPDSARVVNFWEFAEPAPHFAKYVKTTEFSDINYPLIRYADVLLMIAEALVETQGVAAAAPYINEVRNRAGIDDLPATLSVEQMKDSLLAERQKELCLEGHEWYDAVRFGKLVALVASSVAYNQNFAATYPDSSLLATPKSVNVSAFNNLMPVPQSAREDNELLTQNEGY